MTLKNSIISNIYAHLIRYKVMKMSKLVLKASAGTGKTFCTLAAGLQETMENQNYSRILDGRAPGTPQSHCPKH